MYKHPSRHRLVSMQCDRDDESSQLPTIGGLCTAHTPRCEEERERGAQQLDTVSLPYPLRLLSDATRSSAGQRGRRHLRRDSAMLSRATYSSLLLCSNSTDGDNEAMASLRFCGECNNLREQSLRDHVHGSPNPSDEALPRCSHQCTPKPTRSTRSCSTRAGTATVSSEGIPTPQAHIGLTQC